jgi:environmental stress-induced protein Ves
MNADRICAGPSRAGDTAAMTAMSMPTAVVLHAEDYQRMRWKNGAGWTSEVFRFPDADDWGWRLSIAEVETDAPFSTFPGVDRALVLLEGNGMRLRFDDGDTRELLPSSNVLCFSGERPLVGQLVDGPSRDFNLMWKRDRVDAQLWRRQLVGAMVLFADPGEIWVVHMLSGMAHFSGSTGLGGMESGDTAILRSHGARTRFALDGAGELLLIRVVGRDET